MLRFIDIVTRVTRLLDEASSTATSTTNLVEDAVQASHRRICMARTWPFLRWPRDESFTTSSGVRTYALNSEVGKVLHVWDEDRKEFLVLMPQRNWEAAQIDRTSTETKPAPSAIFGGFWPVQAQPASAGTVRIVSSSASDGSGEDVIIRGLNSSGVITEETLTANGVTHVTSTNSFLSVLNVTKVGTWAGTMTLSTSGGTTLLTLLSSEYGKQYPTLEFVETPEANQVYTYAFQRRPRTLSADNDLPEIPFPFSEILVYDTLLDLAAYNSEYETKHIRLWTTRYEQIMKQLNEAMDETIVGSQPRFVRDLDGASGRPTFLLSH